MKPRPEYHSGALQHLKQNREQDLDLVRGNPDLDSWLILNPYLLKWKPWSQTWSLLRSEFRASNTVVCKDWLFKSKERKSRRYFPHDNFQSYRFVGEMHKIQFMSSFKVTGTSASKDTSKNQAMSKVTTPKQLLSHWGGVCVRHVEVNWIRQHLK